MIFFTSDINFDIIIDAFFTSDINFFILWMLWYIRSMSVLSVSSVVKNHSKKSNLNLIYPLKLRILTILLF